MLSVTTILPSDADATRVASATVPLETVPIGTCRQLAYRSTPHKLDTAEQLQWNNTIFQCYKKVQWNYRVFLHFMEYLLKLEMCVTSFESMFPCSNMRYQRQSNVWTGDFNSQVSNDLPQIDRSKWNQF